MLVCDACGYPADPQHIRERIERLELATRFRPVHIRVLLIDAAPPVRAEDYFYRAAKQHSVRSEVSRGYFDELIKCLETSRSSDSDEEAALADFQRHGLFLTYMAECPVGNAFEFESAIRRVAPAMLKRIQLSYKPKFIALLSRASRELIPELQAAGWGDRLILDEGKPFASPSFASPSFASPSIASPLIENPAGRSGDRANLGGRLREAFARLP